MWIFKSDLNSDKFMAGKSIYNKKYLSQLKKEYEKFIFEPISELTFSSFKEFFENGNRIKYESEYFKRRKMLRDFALTAWIYGDKEAIRLTEDMLWAVCNEFTWVLPAHLGDDMFGTTIDLFAAETAQTLAEILSLMKDAVSQEVSKRCVYEIRRRVIEPYLNRKHPYEWENMKNNWCAVCGGCIGMSVIYLIENDAEAKRIADGLANVMKSYIDSFTDDGACVEGLYYWNYGMMYFISFADLYRQRFGKELTGNNSKISRMADFAHKCCMDGGYTVSFSDGFERDGIYAGLSCKLNDMYGADMPSTEYYSDFKSDDCGRWCRSVRDIAWMNENKTRVNSDNTAVFEIAQWVIVKNGCISFAFKGGNNGEPHNHNDTGNIIVIKNNIPLLCDLGAGEYTAKYFSEERYEIFCNSSKGHSVPIIDGMGQIEGASFGAENFFAGDMSASAEISGAYGCDRLNGCIRSVKIEDDYVLIKDSLSGHFSATERFITRCNAEIGLGKIILKNKGETAGTLICENECDIEISRHIHKEHDGSTSIVYAVDFIFSVNGETEFLLKVI